MNISWEKYKLGEVVTLNYGKSLVTEKRRDGNIPVYSSSGISGCHDDALVQSEGIIIGRKGNVGTVFYSQKPFYCIDTAYYILPNKNYDLKFLYYKLLSLNLPKLTSDSAVPGLNRETAYVQEITIPSSIEEQKQIAQILSSLDNKIELNLQMNKTLEDIAQNIFNEWFVNFNFPGFDGVLVDGLPKGWSIKKMYEISNVSSSKRIFHEEYVNSGIPFYRGKEITQLSKGDNITTELYISQVRYDEIKSKFGIPKVGDLLMTSVGTIGSIWLVDNDSPFYFKDGNVTWINDFKTSIKGDYIYQWFQTKGANEQIKSATIGSTQQAITISALKNLDILIPDDTTIIKINSLLEAINLKRICNLNQNKSLSKLRDTLLPKLMSGKIEIKN